MKKNDGYLDNITDSIVVTDIGWERVFLHLVIESDGIIPSSFSLRLFKRKTEHKMLSDGEKESFKVVHMIREIPIRPEHSRGNMYYFVLNITCLDGRNFLDNGTWQIQVLPEGDKGEEKELTCSVAHELAYKLEDKARIFRYGGGKYAYNMSFSTYADDEMNLALVLNSRFMIENKRWKKRHYVQEALTFKGKFKRLHMAAAIKLMRAYYQVFEHLFPKHGKNVMFMTETKDYLWGNLKYINDRIIERGLEEKFHITYSLRKAVGHHKSVFSWVKLVTNIAKQDYIFVDDYVPIFGFLDLNKRTKLIQVWHAGEGFKAVGYCRFGKVGTPFPVGSCHKKYDYVITGSKRLVHIFEEVFGIPENAFLPLGMARLDGFLDQDKIESFRKSFYEEHPEWKSKKIILFAPTYRGKGQKTAYYDYDKLDMKAIYDFCGDEYIWAFKMHPFIDEEPPVPDEYKERIVDLSYYENINDLYYVTDILITDYSSNYFEYALMEKPVIFFTYDREIYELTRGVHRPVKESAPGKVCDTFDEMMEALENHDYEEWKIRGFIDENFRDYDGKASDKAIDRILLGKDEENE